MKGIDNRIIGKIRRLLKLKHIKEINISIQLSKEKIEKSKYSNKPNITRKILFITNKCLYTTESAAEEFYYSERLKDLCFDFSDTGKLEFKVCTNIELVYSDKEIHIISPLGFSQLISEIITTEERINASFASNQRAGIDKEGIFMV